MFNTIFFCAVILIFVLTLVFCYCAFASNKVLAIDMDAIKQIESGGNPKAENRRSGALGLYQITGICLKDFNQNNGTKYARVDLFNPVVNESVARWYLFVRIPQLLRNYNKTVTIDRVLLSYNAGISWAIKDEYPQETINYIKKYKQIARNK